MENNKHRKPNGRLIFIIIFVLAIIAIITIQLLSQSKPQIMAPGPLPIHPLISESINL